MAVYEVKVDRSDKTKQLKHKMSIIDINATRMSYLEVT